MSLSPRQCHQRRASFSHFICAVEQNVVKQRRLQLTFSLILERDLYFRAIHFNFSIFDMRIELFDLRNPKIS